MIKFIIPFLFITTASADMIRVGIIDTGIDFSKAQNLCPDGHEDITRMGINDVHGHGTNVAGIINKNAKNADYCQVIIKYYHNERSLPKENMRNTVVALNYARLLNLDFINYSSTGELPYEPERLVIKKLLDEGVQVVVPSGNIAKNLNNKCDVFPACYDTRLTVVGRRTGNFGYGRIVDFYEFGKNLVGYGITMTGTSQATASVTGHLIYKLWRNK